MTANPDNEDIREDLAAIAAWGDPDPVPSPAEFADRPLVHGASSRTTSRRGWVASGAAAVFVLFVGVLAVRLANGDGDVDVDTAGPPGAAASLPVAPCADVDRFAQRMGNLGIVYDYNPSDSARDLATATDVVVQGDLVGVREESDSGSSFVVFDFTVAQSSQPTIGGGDQIQVNVEFGPASVPYGDIAGSFTPRIPAVLFLHSSGGPGGWTPALEGFWVACGADDSASSAREEPFWDHDGTLGELFASVADDDPEQVAPDDVLLALGFVADDVLFGVDCTLVPEPRLGDRLGPVDLNDGQHGESSTIIDVDPIDARAIEIASPCERPDGWYLALRPGLTPIELQRILGKVVSADSVVSEVSELTEAQRQRIDDDDAVGFLDCTIQGTRTWDYGPINESVQRDDAPVDGLVTALEEVFADDALTALPIVGWIHLTDDNPSTALFLATNERGEWLGVVHVGGRADLGVWRPNSITSCQRIDDISPESDSSETPGPEVAMCAGIEPFLGGEPLHGTMEFGDAWPVLDDDLVLSNGFEIVAFNDGAVRGTLLHAESHPPDASVFVDGSGGLVLQARDRILHIRADRTTATLTLEDDTDSLSFPGYQLFGTAQVEDKWLAYAINAPAEPFEVGEGNLVLLPLDGGTEQIVTKVVQEEGGALPLFDRANQVFVLDWGSLGDRWITGVTITGDIIDLPWNQWSEAAVYELDRVVVGVNGWQAYRGIHDQQGNLTLEGFDSSSGATVYPRETLPIGLSGFEQSIRRLIPLEDRVVISADTIDGPCTRIVGPDGSYVDLPFRGFASPPVGQYGLGNEPSE